MELHTFGNSLLTSNDGQLAFRLVEINETSFADFQRVPEFTIIWIIEGLAQFDTSVAEHQLEAGKVVFFTSYQPFRTLSSSHFKGIAYQFHADFFCIYRHEHEIGCNGLLFNTVYEPNSTTLDEEAQQKFETITSFMKEELEQQHESKNQMLSAQLKLLLITAVRNKEKEGANNNELEDKPFLLQQLKDAINENFRKWHSPSAYADYLNISTRKLGRLTKEFWEQTPSDLITERIMVEAKRELYLTDTPVKAIAYELGFNDEHHFSKYFKNKAGLSPSAYRENVGFNAASN